MGMMEMFHANMAGNLAYRAHAQANRMGDLGKPAEAERLYKEAMAQYLEAERLGCVKSRIMTGFSVLLMREGQYEKARDQLAKLHADPSLTANDKFHLRVNHAICLWRLGGTDKAIESMRQALSYAKTGLAYNVTCSMLNDRARETGDFTEAEAFMQEALTYDEDDIATITNAGWLNYWMGNREAARTYIDRAIRKNPNFPAALTGLALLEYDAGDHKAARTHIDQAMELKFLSASPINRAYAEEIAKRIAEGD